MTSKPSLDWLQKYLGDQQAFEGSLLKYVGSSPRIEELAKELKKDVSEILKLDSNENFFINRNLVNDLALEALHEIDLRLYNPHAINEVLAQLGSYLEVDPACVTIGSGSEQLIDIIIHLFLQRGEKAVTISPSFFMYEKRVRLKNAELAIVPLNDDLALNIEALLKETNQKTRLIFLCSPNNPTANQFEWSQIVEIAESSPALVIVDEAYAEFADYSSAPMAVQKDNIIVVRTFSKAFGLAGVRFGYLISNREIASFLSKVVPYTVNTFTARLVSKMLRQINIVNRAIQEMKEERRSLIKNLQSLKNFHTLPSDTNFVTFRPLDADMTYSSLLKKGIIVKNLGNLPVIGHCLRTTIGLPYMNSILHEALREP